MSSCNSWQIICSPFMAQLFERVIYHSHFHFLTSFSLLNPLHGASVISSTTQLQQALPSLICNYSAVFTELKYLLPLASRTPHSPGSPPPSLLLLLHLLCWLFLLFSWSLHQMLESRKAQSFDLFSSLSTFTPSVISCTLLT